MGVVLSLEAQRASMSQGQPWLLPSSSFVSLVLTPVLQQATSGRQKPSCPCLPGRAGCFVPSQQRPLENPGLSLPHAQGEATRSCLPFSDPLLSLLQLAFSFLSTFQLGFPE